ncbi:MAG: hypothetical protein M1337_05270 [Actinobacteria bacterium]|nr:hypothetical protein [Actinomycetota bacterium]
MAARAAQQSRRSTILGFFLLAVMVAAVGAVAFHFFRLVVGLPTQIQVATIAGAAALATGLGGYYLNRFSERRRMIEQHQQEQKLPVYEEFIALWFRFLQETKSSSAESSATGTRG